MMFIKVLTLVLITTLAKAECLPARVEKEFPSELASAAFMRFSPEGDFAIAWGQIGLNSESNGATYLVDLRGKKPKILRTVLAAEAYPVEGDWHLIGSVSAGGTTYYELDELLKSKIFTRSAFRSNVGGLYHVSATLNTDKQNEKIVRTVSYDKLEFSDIKVKFDNGKVISHQKVTTPTKYLCANLGKNGVGPEVMQVMLSKDGKELVGIPGTFTGYLKLFKIKDDYTCTSEDIPISSQKPMFSHPLPGKQNYIAFHTGAEIGAQPIPFGQVSIYDRDLKKYLRASLPEDKVVSFSPGTLRDGRVIFIRSDGKDKAKLVITDPYQMNPGVEGLRCLEKKSSANSNSESQEIKGNR
ncbi:MAG: hypothetical protein ACLGGX_11610 [Bdellovibrionia bacterium]